MIKINAKRVSRMIILSMTIGVLSLCGVTAVQPTGTNAVVAEVKAATMGEKNAVAKAKSYLSVSAFSKKGLVKQLKFEGFSTKEANYGVKNCKADWNKQAVKKAKEYLDLSSFSKDGLSKQLKFEGFTDKEVKNAVKKAYK